MQHASIPAILFRDGTADATAAKSLLCTSTQSTWVVSDQATLVAALEAADKARAQGRQVVFALDYEIGALLEPAVENRYAGDEAAQPPLGYIWVFDEVQWLTQASETGNSSLIQAIFLNLKHCKEKPSRLP